jgi:hypothetical protein
MKTSIVTFVQQIVSEGDSYTGAHFKRLAELEHAVKQDARGKPGNFSPTVSARNHGETAFQRALFAAGTARLRLKNTVEDVKWNDIELPVVFSSTGRRRCIDLIGQSKSLGSFLCELKFTHRPAGGAGNLPDYAILQAVLYFEAAQVNWQSLEAETFRHKDAFKWEKVVASKTIMVLGNSRLWRRSQKGDNPKRIAALISRIKNELGLTILFCQIPDYPFKRVNAENGRYLPEFDLPAGADVPELTVFAQDQN